MENKNLTEKLENTKLNRKITGIVFGAIASAVIATGVGVYSAKKITDGMLDMIYVDIPRAIIYTATGEKPDKKDLEKLYNSH